MEVKQGGQILQGPLKGALCSAHRPQAECLKDRYASHVGLGFKETISVSTVFTVLLSDNLRRSAPPVIRS